MKYNPSVHAVERVRQYFGVMEDSAKNFVNQLMGVAKYVTTQADGKHVYKHEGKDAMLVVDTKTNTIITVLPPHGKGLRNHANIDTSILKPIFDREYRRIKREVTRNVRQHELAIAQLTVEMGERMIAYARARNPKTRDLIQRDIDEIQTAISGHEAAITREQDRLTNFVKATEVYV